MKVVERYERIAIALADLLFGVLSAGAGTLAASYVQGGDYWYPTSWLAAFAFFAAFFLTFSFLRKLLRGVLGEPLQRSTKSIAD